MFEEKYAVVVKTPKEFGGQIVQIGASIDDLRELVAMFKEITSVSRIMRAMGAYECNWDYSSTKGSQSGELLTMDEGIKIEFEVYDEYADNYIDFVLYSFDEFERFLNAFVGVMGPEDLVKLTGTEYDEDGNEVYTFNKYFGAPKRKTNFHI